jgi:hypothetical protein
MFKTVFFLLNLVFAVMLNVIFGEGVKVTQNIPAKVNPGDEFTVEVTINKSDVSGFAKIQQEIPVGMEAQPISTQGASFTFNDQKVKLIWMSLPNTEEFTITYKIIVGENVTGDLPITGKFSYLYKNERKVIDMPTNIVKVGGTEELVVEKEPAPIQEPEKPQTALAPKNIEVTAERKITEVTKGNFNIELSLKNNGIAGFSKIQESLPKEINEVYSTISNKSVFSFVDNQAKFVWMSTPTEENILVSYTIYGKISLEELEKKLTGSFAFIENEETKKVDFTTISSESLVVEEVLLAEETPVEEATQDTPKVEEVVAKKVQQPETPVIVEKKAEPIQEQVAEEITGTPTEPTSGIPDPNAKKETTKITGSTTSENAEVIAATTPPAKTEEKSTAQQENVKTAAPVQTQPNQPVVEQQKEPVKQTTTEQTKTNEPISQPVAEKQPVKETPTETEKPKENLKGINYYQESLNNIITETDKTQTTATTKKEPVMTQTPAPQKGIYFKVQICAGHDNVPVEKHFEKEYKFNEEPISVETHEGWIKYTIGSHQAYESAKNRRNEVTAKYTFPGPFVTAYNEGQRITVQEALMITNQKWVK